MENKPLFSLIVSTRNEQKHIARCLDSLIRQDYPKESMEVFVVDGRSEDKTREVVREYGQKYPFIKLLDNPQKATPYAFNIGIKNSQGEFVVIMSGHSSYQENYLSTCLKYINQYNVDIVGGIVRTVPTKGTLVAKSIALALSHKFGSGNAYFRTGYSKGPKEVDTVFGACYKREVFDRVGLFNEKLTRSQDMEFNLRVKKAGGKIILFPDIISYYYPKSTLWDFFLHNIEDGIWAVYPLKLGEETLASRHYTPLFFVLALLVSWFLGFFSYFFYQLFLLIIALYFSVSIYFSIKISIREKDSRLAALMPIAFGARHFGYGLGSVWGLLTIWKLKTE